MVSVTRISIAPVKGLALVHPDEVELERTGVLENRRFYIVDADGRRYGQLRNGRLVCVRAAYDAQRERLTLTFPDGTVADGNVALGDEITTDFYGRPVTGRLVRGPWSDALSEAFHRPLRLVQPPPGAAVDRGRGHVSRRERRRPPLPDAVPGGRRRSARRRPVAQSPPPRRRGARPHPRHRRPLRDHDAEPRNRDPRLRHAPCPEGLPRPQRQARA